MTVVMFPSHAVRQVPPVAAAPRAPSAPDLPALLKLLGRAFADYHAACGQPALLLGRSAVAPDTFDIAAADRTAFATALRLNGFLPCSGTTGWRHPLHPDYRLVQAAGGRSED